MKASSLVFRLISTAAVGLVLTAGASRTAAAQWGASVYGVGEYDTDQTFLILAGFVASPGGRGWHPHVGVQAYNVSFDAGPGRESVTSVKPFVGLSNGLADGEADVSVGYAFTNKEVAFASTAVGESGDGVVLSGGYQTYGATTPLAWQLLGSYNFGSEAVWARARATSKLSANGPKSVRLGGEFAVFHEDPTSVWQPGAVLEFHNGASVFGLGAGMKFYDGGNNVYFKVEGSLPVGRR